MEYVQRSVTTIALLDITRVMHANAQSFFELCSFMNAGPGVTLQSHFFAFSDFGASSIYFAKFLFLHNIRNLTGSSYYQLLLPAVHSNQPQKLLLSAARGLKNIREVIGGEDPGPMEGNSRAGGVRLGVPGGWGVDETPITNSLSNGPEPHLPWPLYYWVRRPSGCQ